MIIIPVVILAAFTALAWHNFKFALTLLVALTPAYLIRFELGIPWTVLEGMILIAFAIWLLRHHGLQFNLRTFSRYRAPLFFLLAIASFAALWAPDLTSALGIWKAYFIEPVMVFAMLRTTFTERVDWMRALHGLALTVIAIAVFAVFQKLTGLGLPIPWDVERRATSFFAYPNAVGLFVAPVVAAIVVMGARWLMNRRTGPSPAPTVMIWIMGFAVIFGLAAIVLAETEAALVAIPIALILVLLVSRATAKTKIAALMGLAMLALVILAAVPVTREKLLLQDYSGGVRRAQWSETIELLKDRPLQGAGLAGYPTVFEPYHDPRLYEIFQYPHNVILNFWVEMGIFGVIAFIAIALVTIKLAWQRRDDALVLAALAALVTMTIHGMVDVPFFKNDLAVLTVFFLAMMLAGDTRKEILDISSY